MFDLGVRASIDAYRDVCAFDPEFPVLLRAFPESADDE